MRIVGTTVGVDVVHPPATELSLPTTVSDIVTDTIQRQLGSLVGKLRGERGTSYRACAKRVSVEVDFVSPNDTLFVMEFDIGRYFGAVEVKRHRTIHVTILDYLG